MNIIMNRNPFMTLAVVIAVAFLANASLVYAGGDRHECGEQRADFHHSGKHLKRMTEKLDLSNAQQQEIKELLEASREKMDELHNQMRGLHEQMASLTPESQTYMKEASRLAREKSELMEKQFIEQARIHLSINKVLTPEQRETAKELHKQRMKKHIKGHKDWNSDHAGT